MATLYTHQSKNIGKTWLLMVMFLILVVGIGFIFSQIYGDPNILYGFFMFAIFMNFFSYWFSDKIAIRMAGAKLASESEFRDLHNIVENLSITAGLPKPRVFIIHDPAPNAFATGRDKKHAAVAVTTGLLAILDRSELEGVIAHELSHIGNRDILVATVAVVLAGFIAIISDIFLRSHIFGGRNNDRGGNVLVIIGIALAILAPIFAILMQLAISRKREFLADASGALLTRYPEGLASALEKISSYARPMQRQSSAIAHLFLANPRPTERHQLFGQAKGKTSGFKKLWMTHPPMEDRVKALLNK